MTTAEKFFYDHAGYSYVPGEETPEQGRIGCAKALARDEAEAREAGLSFDWDIDPEVSSSDWNDEQPAWEQWSCVCYNSEGKRVESLWGIDFGRDGTPWGDPYRRVIEAELALLALRQTT